MSGVGETLGPELIAEIGDVRRFSNKGSLMAFAGVERLHFNLVPLSLPAETSLNVARQHCEKPSFKS